MNYNDYLKLQENQKRTLILPILLKGREIFEQTDTKSFIDGLKSIVDTSDVIQLPFQKTDYKAQIRVMLEKKGNDFYIHKINLFSTYNDLEALDVTEKFKKIDNVGKELIEEWIDRNN